MKRVIGYVTLAAAGAALAWGQHGHGGGMGGGIGGGHGAPISFPPAAKAANTGMATPRGGVHTTDIGTRVAANPELSARVQPLIPSGMTVATASAGFRNQGQFLAALHVSKNLSIPFQQLKTEMTGTNDESLGKAIGDLRPDLDKTAVKTNVKRAERQAKLDTRPAAGTRSVSVEIARNPRLASRVGALLPAGMSLQTAAAGFKNQGQFIAALHVARNLGIPFAQVKAEMMTGKSLGGAITDLRPALSTTVVEADVRTAQRQARIDIEVTERNRS